jgi:uncharacterized Zn-finger protein
MFQFNLPWHISLEYAQDAIECDKKKVQVNHPKIHLYMGQVHPHPFYVTCCNITFLEYFELDTCDWTITYLKQVMGAHLMSHKQGMGVLE